MRQTLFSILGKGIEYSAGCMVWHKRIIADTCTCCGRVRHRAVFADATATVTGVQKKWPDILSCGFGFIAVKELVIENLQAAGATGFLAHRLTLKGFGKCAPDSQYWMIEPTGTASFVLASTDEIGELFCKRCGMWNEFEAMRKNGNLPNSPIQVVSWDGCDFVMAKFADRLCAACSDKIVDLAKIHDWTNCEFTAYANPQLTQHYVHYKESNWQELLAQSISRREAELRGEKNESVQVEVSQVPNTKEPSARPTSDHPFDNLSAFDGTAWQGTTTLPCTFGLCDFVVYEDDKAEFNVADNADYLPMSGQRKLFDFFATKQESLLPSLRDCLVETLRHGKEPFPPVDAAFPDLAKWLEAGGPEIKNAGRGGCGVVTLFYTIKETDAVITVEIACSPAKNGVKVKSCEIA